MLAFNRSLLNRVRSGPTKPTKEKAKCKLSLEQEDDPCFLKPFLRTKRIAGIDKPCLINCNLGYAYTNGILVLSEGLDMFRPEAVATGGWMMPSGNLSFTKGTLFG
jgi:hypothetical protein